MQDINHKQNIEIAEIKTEMKNIKELVKKVDGKLEFISINCLPTLTKEVARMEGSLKEVVAKINKEHGERITALEGNDKIFKAFMFAIVAALIGLYFV
jgi:hypothetical protein